MSLCSVSKDRENSQASITAWRPCGSCPSWQDLIRAERTDPACPAVSQVRQDNSAGGPGGFPAEPVQTDAITLDGQTSQATSKFVGFYKLKSLLRPLHEFFKDKIGWIDSFHVYQDGERSLVYPKVKAFDRDNPYRRYRLNRKSSARNYKRIRQFVESKKLDDFVMASLVITMPHYMSEYLAGKGISGRGMAWRLFEGFWSEDLPVVIGQRIELASHTNFHPWRSEKPFLPHFHFHTLIPNYGLKNTGITDEEGNEAFEFVRWEWHRQRGGREVPFSDSQLEKLKALWRDRLARFCRRHGLEFNEGKIDIYVEYIDQWVKLHHKFNYNGRHWTENYAEYSNIHPDCPSPPDWLMHYDNKARVKGWWSNLKNITHESQEKIKVSPYTGEDMAYKEKYYSVEVLLDCAGGVLGYVEFIKGRPLEGDMSEDDIEWLKGVMVRAI